MEALERSPVTPERVRTFTAKDPVLSRVRHFVSHGWPDTQKVKQDDALKPYATRKDELSVHEGVLLWGARVVVPRKCRDQMLDELHDAHPGIVAMKAKVRTFGNASEIM